METVAVVVEGVVVLKVEAEVVLREAVVEMVEAEVTVVAEEMAVVEIASLVLLFYLPSRMKLHCKVLCCSRNSGNLLVT
jgi:hypothetical protein